MEHEVPTLDVKQRPGETRKWPIRQNLGEGGGSQERKGVSLYVVPDDRRL